MMFFRHRKLKLPRELADRLQAAAIQAGYSSTEEFVIHVLEAAAEKIERDCDRELMDQQLRGLGYLE